MGKIAREAGPELGERISTLADQIVELALSSDNNDFKLDCFKQLSTFFVNVSKLGAKVPDDDDDTPSLRAMRERVKAAEGEGK